MARTAHPARYSRHPLPAYGHVPGETPHPRRDQGGHSCGQPDPVAAPWEPAEWRALDLWLYAVDLFNHGYWWECHEALEALWQAAGRTTAHALFVQGLLQVAAGLLNRRRGKPMAELQSERGLRRMESVANGVYMGLDVATFTAGVRKALADREPAPVIMLANDR